MEACDVQQKKAKKGSKKRRRSGPSPIPRKPVIAGNVFGSWASEVPGAVSRHRGQSGLFRQVKKQPTDTPSALPQGQSALFDPSFGTPTLRTHVVTSRPWRYVRCQHNVGRRPWFLQTVGKAVQPLPGYIPPNNAMVQQHTDPGAPFLITTAPRFAKGASTSSNYLLQALGDDPSTIHKRLGDGYYEQNLVMDQLLQLTGRRTLNGGDGLAQYQSLMDNAAAQAQALGLSLGAPLTTTQIASLSSDIVWLVDQVVDGQHVLVPVVYLSKATADRMDAAGALIAGNSVDIQSSGTVRNDGTITGSKGVSLSANTLINQGAIGGGDRLTIATRGNTVNAGALSANTIAIQAGGDVVNAPTFDGIAAHGGTLTAGTGGVQIVAAHDVINQGAITSTGDGVIVAGRDYVQNAATSTQGTKAAAGSLTTAGNAAVIAGRDAVFNQSTVSAGQVAYIDAGRDAHFTATTVSGGTGVGVVAGQDIVSDTVTDHAASSTFTKQGKNWTATTTTDDTVRGSTLASGGDVTMQAGRDISLTAANVKADGAVGMAAGRDINLAAGENTHTETQDSVSKHGKTKTTTHSETDDTTTAGTSISGAQGVVMAAGQDINAVAATITSSDSAVFMHADRDINLLAGQNTHSEMVDSTSTKKGFLKKTTTTSHDESHDTTAVGTVISGSNVAIDAGRDVNAQAAQVSAEHGLAISAARDVNLVDAHDVHTEEHDKTVKKSSAFGSGLDLGNPGKKSASTAAEQRTDDTVHGTTLSGGDGVIITAGRDVNAIAASVTSTDGVVGMHADRDINLLSDVDTHTTSGDTRNKTTGHYYGSKTTTTQDSVSDTQAVGTTVSGHNGVAIDAGHNVLTVGGAIHSDAGGIAVTAGEQIAMLAAQNTHDTDHGQSTRESGFEQVPNQHQGTRKKDSQTEQVTSQGTTLDAAGPIVLASGGDQAYQAVNVHSDAGTTLISGGHIDFVTATDSDAYSRDSSKHNVAYQAQDHRGHVDTTEQQSSFTGPLAIAAANGITVGIGQKDGETQAQAIARSVEANPSSAWIYALQDNPNVTWQSVDETHTSWHQHQEGMTSAAAAVVTVVVTYFTAGLASSAVASATASGAATGAASGAAASASASTFAAGGLGNAIVAGAVSGAAGSAAGAASQGYDWKQAALKGAISGGIGGGAFYAAGSMTTSTADGGWGSATYDSGSWQKVVAHAAAGGAANGLTGGSIKNGIISGGFAEGIGPYLTDLPGGPFGQAVGHAASGAAGSWLSGGDAGQGAITGLSGYMFNYLYHAQRDQRDADVASCKDDQGCAQDQEAKWNAISTNQNVAMGEGLINSGVLPQDLADQLRSTDPSSPAYVELLTRAVSYGPTPWLSYQLVNEIDGAPGMSAASGGWDSQARASVEMSLALPFAAPAAGVLVAAGASETIPATAAWGSDALAAYRAATASYSLGVAAASGALGSGTIYTASNLIGAEIDASKNDTTFTQTFDQRFSYWGLGGSMAVGAAGGVYQAQMFQWAGVPNSFANWLTPAGAVIRINKTAAGMAAGKATQAAVQESQKNNSNKKN